jgi:AmmeMemoRadiSam system protein A
VSSSAVFPQRQGPIGAGTTAAESLFLRLAREAIHERIEGRDPLRLLDSWLTLHPPQACFVSLKMQGRLRGCIGTLLPTRPSLEAEIVANAVAASQRDPRFPAVRAPELPRLAVSLDLLSAPEPVSGMADLDPSRYGVIVRSGGLSGVLLPDLPGVETVERQLAICRDKAGIPPDVPVTLQRFTVVRLAESG